MIMFWNRKEVFIGFSVKAFGEVRDILSANEIKYTYRVVSSFGSSRAHTGSLGVKSEFAYQYYVYVHRHDYDYACALIGKH